MRGLFSVRGNSSIKINLLLLDLMLDLEWPYGNTPLIKTKTIRVFKNKHFELSTLDLPVKAFLFPCVYQAALQSVIHYKDSFIIKRHYKASLIRLSDPILR